MRSLLFASATAAALTTLGLLSSTASAQAPNPAGANASKHGIAVVDVSYIFKMHAKFKATMESMKGEMEKIETELKADRDRIAQMEQQRNGFNVGSNEYKQADEEIARMMAEFNLKMTRLRKDFLEREAKVYYQTYLEVNKAVEYYAQRHNIGLVLRFNGEPVDANRREEVLREINKPVVYQNSIDITPDVLALLNRGPVATPGATSGAAPTATRPAGTQIPPR